MKKNLHIHTLIMTIMFLVVSSVDAAITKEFKTLFTNFALSRDKKETRNVRAFALNCLFVIFFISFSVIMVQKTNSMMRKQIRSY